jgi:NitT/TauT family transport system substrate-binding protein
MRRTIVTSVALAAVLAFTAAACGDDDDDGGAAEGTEAPAAEGTSAPAGGAATTAAADEETDVTTGVLIPVRLQLQWVTQAQFAGYFAAIDQGYYTDAGLDVQILEGGVDIVPQTVLAQGGADFAIAWVPKALQSREQGAQITDIGQIFQRSGTLQVSWADSGITSPEDFSGKNIGNWGFGNEFELFAGMTQAGLDPATDVSLVQQNFDMLALLNRDIDAAQAMTYNEYAQVLEAVNPDTGELYQPEDFSVIDWNEVGTAMLQDAIWADTERLESDEEYAATAEAFVKASIQGWVYCRDNPQECADLVVAQGSQLGASHQLWQMNEINKLIWPSPNGIGVIDQAAWDQTVQVALETKNAEGSTVITAEPEGLAFTNDIVEAALAGLTEEGLDVTGENFEPIEVELLEGGA